MDTKGLTVWLLMACVAGAAGAAPKPPPDEELKELRGRIEKLREDLSAKEESHAEAADQLKESERAISDTTRRIAELTADSREMRAELAALQAEIEAVSARMGKEQASVERLLRARYMEGTPQAIRLILSGAEPATVARRLHYYGHLSRARLAVVESLQQDRVRLAELKQAAQRKSDELARLRAQELEEQRALKMEQAKRQQLLTSLSGQIAGQRKEIERLRTNEGRLTRLVEELNRLLAKRRAEQEARRRAKAAAPPRQPAENVVKSDEAADASLAGQAFAALKGRLRLPVRGSVLNRFGAARDGGGPSWKGLFIRAETGQPVRAVADGRVVFADWLRGFGNLLILDHGAGYMTLYGYNEALLKAVGELIRGGDAIAQVGNTGAAPDSGVYFELRHLSQPLDPLGWIAR